MIKGIQKYYTPGKTILRNVDPQRNDIGGFIDDWQQILCINGRIRPLSGNEREAAGKQTLFASHKLYCDILDINEKDRIHDAADDQTYEVKFVSDPMHMGNHLEVYLELIR